MASAGKPAPEQVQLGIIADQVAALQDEAKRLNLRLRNARAATQSIEDALASLADEIKRHAQLLEGRQQ